jgi:hypothetical protein
LQNNQTYAMITHASNNLLNCYDDKDLRLSTYFVRDLFGEPAYADGGANAPVNPSRNYHAYGKMQIRDDGSGIPAINVQRFIPVDDSRTYGQALRITEAYLILAEAQAMLGHPQEAIDALTPLWNNRFAAGTPSPYSAGTDVVALVRNERRREFCFEALRWFDLRRWGMPRMEHVWYSTSNGTRQTFVLEKNDPGYTFPMPVDILTANPDLSQVPLAGDSRKPM